MDIPTLFEKLWPYIARRIGQSGATSVEPSESGAAGDAWNLTGNAGTLPGVNFVGTTDAQELHFKTNATERMRLEADAAELGIGKTATAGNSVDAAASVHADADVTAGAAVTAGTNVTAQASLCAGADGVAAHALVMLGDDTDGTWEAIRSSDNLALLRKETTYIQKFAATPDGISVGSGEAGKDYTVVIIGETNNLTLTWMEDEVYLKTTAPLRGATSLFRRVIAPTISAINPAAAGGAWVEPGTASGGNISAGGWRLSNAAHTLSFGARVGADWDAATDLIVDCYFEVGVDNSGGAAGDTIDLRLRTWYKQPSETAAKTQTVEVATTVGTAGIYKAYKATFTIDFDLVANVVEAGDAMGFILNLETDTSEVDNAVINHVSLAYQTSHASVESGDA